MTLLELALGAGALSSMGLHLVTLRDLVVLSGRVEQLELGNEREDATERKLQDQSRQLRQDLDEVVQRRRRTTPRPPTLRGAEARCETLEAGFTPPRQPNDTEVFSPNAPKLPAFPLEAPIMGMHATCHICGKRTPCYHDFTSDER
jgi:hypothetical protein